MLSLLLMMMAVLLWVVVVVVVLRRLGMWILRLRVVMAVVVAVVPGIEVVGCLHCRRRAHEGRYCRVEAAVAAPRSPLWL